ncbi:MAG TPA: portal protein [Spirochaetota bacterium]|nr:portal protein [Spirochaetota bacterium]
MLEFSKILEMWKVADNEWDDWRTRAKKAYDFYLGDQWDPAVRDQLRLESRPALTFNKIKPIIRNLSGYQRQNRQDLKVVARKGANGTVAEFLTEICKYIYDVSLADWQLSQVFIDGIIGGKGWVMADIDYEKDPLNGDIVIRRENPFMIHEDPFATQYDLSDANFIFRSYWDDINNLQLIFPKVKDIALLPSMSMSDREKIGIETDDYVSPSNSGGSFEEIAKYRYKVRDCWYRQYEKKRILIDINTLEAEDASGKSVEFLQNLVNQYPHLRAVERVIPKLCLTTFVGNIILQEVENPFGPAIRDFPFVRYCDEHIYAHKNIIRGEVDDLIDPQQELNKRRSQALHHLNSSANSGFITEEDAMPPGELRKLETMGSKPGVVVIAYPGKKDRIEKIRPNELSQGHIQLEKLSEDDLKKISGVNADLLGYPSERAESGVAMDLRRKHGLMTTEQLFDNFEYSQRLLGQKLVDFIRKTDVISDEEMEAIAEERNFKPVDKSTGMPVNILDLAKSRKVGKYGIVMSTRDSSPTQRLYNFQTMIDAMKNGLQIPQDLIVKSSDWPFKDELLERLKQAQEAQAAGAIPGAPQPNPSAAIPA